MKELLDDQWGIDTVYQDQYPSLLYATETGRMITAQPSLVTTGIMDQFKSNLTNGINEVRCHAHTHMCAHVHTHTHTHIITLTYDFEQYIGLNVHKRR